MDKLVTALSKNREVRIYFADTTQAVEKARKIHDLSPMSGMIMGRLLTVTVMMGMMSKIDEETVTVQIRGNGPMKKAIAVADTHGNVKVATDYPHLPNVYDDMKQLDIASAVGGGTLYVTHDYGRGEPFTGQVKMVSGRIADDMTHYFAQSEQIATAVELGVRFSSQEAKVRSAGGIIIQLLPGASKETISYLEKQLTHKEGVSEMVQDTEDIAQAAALIMGDLGIDELESYAIRYYCGCKRSKMLDALYSLGADELRKMVVEDGGAQTICRYCGKVMEFNKFELNALIDKIESENK